MSLVLNNRDLARHEAALQALLSPLEHATVTEWAEAVARELASLFEAPHAFCIIPSEGRINFATPGFEPSIGKAIRGVLIGTEHGRNRYADVKLNAIFSALAREGVDVWNNELSDRLSPVPLAETLWFREILFPVRAIHTTAMGVGVQHGMAVAGVAHPSASANPFAGTDLELMRLLLSPFKAGVHMLARLDRRRRDLSRCLDALEEPLMVQDFDGRELYRNAALNTLIDDEPEADVVLSVMRLLGIDLVRGRRSRAKTSHEASLAGGSREVRTQHGMYELVSCYLAPDAFVRDAAVLVTVVKSPQRLPSLPILLKRFEFTPREGEVALLLAAGRSNREIAKVLFVSPHTVRHHAEHVFLKLDVHTRKALALRLLGDIG